MKKERKGRSLEMESQRRDKGVRNETRKTNMKDKGA